MIGMQEKVGHAGTARDTRGECGRGQSMQGLLKTCEGNAGEDRACRHYSRRAWGMREKIAYAGTVGEGRAREDQTHRDHGRGLSM
jgi:hypothetical protein